MRIYRQLNNPTTDIEGSATVLQILQPPRQEF